MAEEMNSLHVVTVAASDVAIAKAIMYVDLLFFFFFSSHCFFHVKLKSRTNCVMCQLRYSLVLKLMLCASQCDAK